MTLKTGSSGPNVLKLQNGLNSINCPCGKADGDFGPKTELTVAHFQKDHNLLADGIAGPITLKIFNSLVKPEFQIELEVHEVPNSVAPTTLIPWVTVGADVVSGSGGYQTLTLRSDAAEAYRNLATDVHSLGGKITTAGGRRALSSGSSPARSKMSMHYTGLAFDLATDTGMLHPDRDPFLIERDGTTRYWKVWCRSSLDEATLTAKCKELGIAGGKLKLNVYKVSWDSNKKMIVKQVPMQICVFSFTELAAKYGWGRIPGKVLFFSGNSYDSAEWWHFQWTTKLLPHVSKFGEELLKVYSLAQAQKFLYWTEVKNAVFGEGWN